MKMPKLSIITVNLNNASGLQKTMESVFAQTFTDYQYIIIDGGSTDGSKELMEKHQKKFVYAISEKDNGIYNAMNKGIEKAQGEYLLFLNSGDFLVNNQVLSSVLAQSENKDIIYCILVIDKKGHIYHKEYPENLQFSFFLKDTIPQPSSLIKRSLFSSVGLFNENLRSTSDWEFFLNAICKYNVTYKYIPIPFTVFNTEGISQQKENWHWIWNDKQDVLKKSYPAFMSDYEMIASYKLQIQEYQQRLKNIENSRFWKLRSRFLRFSIMNLFVRNDK
jgi:glycosyltransferase involved in cell wall biosynthesis